MEESVSFSLASGFLMCTLLNILIKWVVCRFLVESNLHSDYSFGSGLGSTLGGYPHIVRHGAPLVAVNAPIFSHGENLKLRGQGTSYCKPREVESTKLQV